jgi:hypothetical protein
VAAEEPPRTRHPQVALLAEGLGTRDDCRGGRSSVAGQGYL